MWIAEGNSYFNRPIRFYNCTKGTEVYSLTALQFRKLRCMPLEGPLMTWLRLTTAAFAALILSVSAGLPSVYGATGKSMSIQTAPDNSAANKDQAGTAQDQSNAKEDRLTTAKIRKAIIADKDLSTYAHNIKIITTNGSVTLKGPVKSEDEKEKVASDAAGVVSADRITNNLTVKQ